MRYNKGIGVSRIFFICIWFASLVTKKNSIIDAAWGLHYFLISLFYFFELKSHFNTPNMILLTTMTLWGLRLGGFLFYRYLIIGEDHRYETIKKNWNANDFTFIKMFLLQGFIAGILSLTMLFAFAFAAEISISFIIGISIMLIFIIFESIDDFQLFQFVTNPLNKNKICNIGLWKFTRHPNYFSEWMIWVGLLIIILGNNFFLVKLVACLGPVLIYLLLNFVSGIPIIEKNARKGIFKKIGEEEYIRNTPAFFPKFK